MNMVGDVNGDGVKLAEIVINMAAQGVFTSLGAGQYVLTAAGQRAIDRALENAQTKAHYEALVQTGVNRQIARLTILITCAWSAWAA